MKYFSRLALVFALMAPSFVLAEEIIAEVLVDKKEYVSVPSEAFAAMFASLYQPGSYHDPQQIRQRAALGICTHKHFTSVVAGRYKNVDRDVQGVLAYQFDTPYRRPLLVPQGIQPRVKAKFYQSRWSTKEIVNAGYFWKLDWRVRRDEYDEIEVGELHPNEVFTSLICRGDENHIRRMLGNLPFPYENLIPLLKSEAENRAEGSSDFTDQQSIEMTDPRLYVLKAPGLKSLNY